MSINLEGKLHLFLPQTQTNSSEFFLLPTIPVSFSKYPREALASKGAREARDRASTCLIRPVVWDYQVELLLGPYQPLQIGIHGLACVGNYVIFPLQVMLYSRGCPAHAEYECVCLRKTFLSQSSLSFLFLSLFPFSIFI